MATPTLKEIQQAKSDADARDQASVYDALTKFQVDKNIPKLAEVVGEVAKRLTPKRIAKIWSDEILEGDGRDKRDFLKAFLNSLRTIERAREEFTETQASRLMDEQLIALLGTEYGIVKRKDGNRTEADFIAEAQASFTVEDVEVRPEAEGSVAASPVSGRSEHVGDGAAESPDSGTGVPFDDADEDVSASP